MSATLHAIDDEFHERNMFLQVTLGLVSLARQFDDLLGRYGLGAAPWAVPVQWVRPDDRALDALLGLVALSQRLTAYVNAACAHMPPALIRAEDSPGRSAVSLRDLLA